MGQTLRPPILQPLPCKVSPVRTEGVKSSCAQLLAPRSHVPHRLAHDSRAFSFRTQLGRPSPPFRTLSATLEGVWARKQTPSPHGPSQRALEPSARQRRRPAAACAVGARRPCVGLGCTASGSRVGQACAHRPNSPASTPPDRMIGAERRPQRAVYGACGTCGLPTRRG